MSHAGGNNVQPVRTAVVRLSDYSERIRSLGKTMIGNIMNPQTQNAASLVSIMPNLWKLDDGRVVGRDLGSRMFRFDFQREQDILHLLESQPFSFNGWMVSLVRWEPIIHKDYPSAITFWVRTIGVPMHFWTEPVLRRIGSELGTVAEVDEANAMVKVTIDSTKPLCFGMSVRFETGGEAMEVLIEYEKLSGYCGTCFSLRHDKECCQVTEKSRKDVFVDLSKSN